VGREEAFVIQSRLLQASTPRLLLRVVADEDAAVTAALVTPDVAENLLTWPAPMSEAQARAKIAKAKDLLARREAVNWAIVRRDDSQLMGWIGFVRETASCAKVGYWLGAEFRGQGYLRETALTVIPLAARFLEVSFVWAEVYPRNRPSIALLERVGFERFGSGTVHSPVTEREEPTLQYRLPIDQMT